MAFKFKKFSIEDEKCTMKVGTDSVLFGAWVNPGNALSILDIGTGSGIIALMLAQRSEALIDGIDIDEASVEQAKENVKKSKWGKRVSIVHCPVQKYFKMRANHYDLIVCNPPYFSDQLKSPEKIRNIAKHSEYLSFDEIIVASKKLLKTYGRICLILPTAESNVFKEKALISNLYLTRIMTVRHHPNKEVKRVMMQFECLRKNRTEESISIYDNSGEKFSKEYMELTKDYYLKF